MKIGVLGTGGVGVTIATALVDAGQDVRMGSRSAGNPKAVAWVATHGASASEGSFADAAAFGETVFNCTAGSASLAALRAAGAANLTGKILVDLANPLDFSKGMPPVLTVCNTDSLGEQIQREFPGARVVKTLNTVNATLMANPSIVPGQHQIFVSGDDAAAKEQVRIWLADWFGWGNDNILDLGGIDTARGTEMYLAFWIRAMVALETPLFNIHLARAVKPGS
jgi:8-hydroxy-5-deazaflavin:NADPH oxidoreductase